ncbi:MAG TPA: HypC/HybG/HupF family hydrogenase formation chaperone [Ktedonobacteraceae bacterium]|jgi:hypothetical protein|nr:HypC/HybG/HupF family hydrogenase formation chaperone [Ktedonobacteraceae bacterium]
MSDEAKKSLDPSFVIDAGMYCTPSEDGHCTTCSDEALQAKVLRIDEETGLALVEVIAEETRTEEVDVSLIENVAPGDLLLVHGGVAIGTAGI